MLNVSECTRCDVCKGNSEGRALVLEGNLPVAKPSNSDLGHLTLVSLVYT